MQNFQLKDSLGFWQRPLIKSEQFPIFNFFKAAGVLIFALSLPLTADAAELYFEPSSQTIRQGEIFTVEVWLDSQGQEINAVEGDLLFSQDKIELVDASRGGSLLEFWLADPIFSNQTGEVNFSGGISKGFLGKGKLLSLNFRPVPLEADIATAQIVFQNGSRVLLNNGYGSEASLSLKAADFVAIAAPEGLPEISSKTHPNQSVWYKENKPIFSWEAAQGTEYSYQLTSAANKVVFSGETAEREIGQAGGAVFDLSKEEDGVFYLSLRQKLSGQDWSKEAAHFRVMIDDTPPEEFLPKIGKDDSISAGRYFISFTARDKTSGISRYELAEIKNLGIFDFLADYFGRPVWKEATSPYLLARQDLKAKILIKAVDEAGNERTVKVIPPSNIVYWQIATIILVLIILATIIVVVKKSREKKK